MKKSFIKIIEGWEIDTEEILAKFLIASIVFLIFYVLGKVFRHITFRINSKLLSKFPDIPHILSLIVYYCFVTVGCFFALKIIGLEQYFVKLLAGAGIVGIIAGFALKDIASNAFAGLLLFFEKPFNRGDWVQLDGHYGEITRIGILTTSMTNKSGQEVFISNQLIYSGVFINYSIYKKRNVRIQVEVVDYTDLQQLKKIVTDKIKTNDAVLPNADVHFYVISLGATNSFTFELYFWVAFENESNFLKVVDETILIIKQINTENNISITNAKWISDEENVSSSGQYGLGG